MNKPEQLQYIKLILNSLEESVLNYTDTEESKGYAPVGGCQLILHDSKTSIQRRILLLREELLELSKSFDE